MAFYNNFTKQTVFQSSIYIIVSFVAIGVVYIICKIVIRAANIDKKKQGVFTALFTYSNSVYIGLPVAIAIFGQSALALALFYYIANTTFMNSLGFLEIAKDGQLINGKKEKIGIGQIAKKILQPPIIGIGIGFALVMSGITLPEFLASALDMTGQITSPLALMFMGIVLQRTGISCIKKIDKETILVLIGRFVVSPLIIFTIATLSGISEFSASVLTIQMSLPAMMGTVIFAEHANANSEFATKGVAITTLISFITIPIFVAIFGG